MSKKPKLEDVPGVGPKTAESLKEAGIKTVAKLAKSDPAKLAEEVSGLGETTAENLVKEAKKLAPPKKSAPKKKDKKPKKTAKKPKKDAKAEPKLADLTGVGPATQKKLKKAGYGTIAAIAKAKPSTLSEEVSGISEDSAKDMIAQAKKLTPKAKKPKKKPKKVEEKPKKKAKKKPKKEAKKPKKEPEPAPETRENLYDKRLLRIARAKKARKPKFRHEQAHRWKRVSDSWRKVRGIDSATREKKKGRIAMVSSGYRTPKAVRGLHPSLYKEVLVYRPADLEGLDPDVHAVRIGGTVGGRKRQAIIDKADSMLLRVLNPGVPETMVEEDLFEELEGLEDMDLEDLDMELDEELE